MEQVVESILAKYTYDTKVIRFMFKCTCGYKTCKESYATKTARKQHLAGVKAVRKKNSGKSMVDKIKTRKDGRFGCTCEYHTCKKFYKTERKLQRHQAGVLAARNKKITSESARDKPITPEPEQQPITKDEESPRKAAPEKATSLSITAA